MTPRRPSVLLASLVLVACPGGVEAQRPAPARTCAAEIGSVAARRLAEECRDAGPANPAQCGVRTPCETMREAIAEACRMPGAEARPVCRDRDDDVDEDDDDADE